MRLAAPEQIVATPKTAKPDNVPESVLVPWTDHDQMIRATPSIRSIHPKKKRRTNRSPRSGRRSVPLSADVLRACDCVLLATDHDAVDYALVARHARLVVDTRNVFARNGLSGDHVVKA
jgi:UDP-N-acetyl-D-mannosaminuronate dehydrogenase